MAVAMKVVVVHHDLYFQGGQKVAALPSNDCPETDSDVITIYGECSVRYFACGGCLIGAFVATIRERAGVAESIGLHESCPVTWLRDANHLFPNRTCDFTKRVWPEYVFIESGERK